VKVREMIKLIERDGWREVRHVYLALSAAA
jgi:predicted RNA binding protein YcfA (HicA-like mRNA interferase family)